MLGMTKRAFLTGITGQDGSYLAELLLSKGYEVHGLLRRSSSFNTARLAHLYADPHVEGARLLLHYGDLDDALALTHLLQKIAPQEVYHLAAQSHVRVSFDLPIYTVQAVALGTLHMLEAVRHLGQGVRFYQASSSEMYGKVREIAADRGRRRFTPAARTPARRSMATGRRSTTARPTVFSPATASSSTTNRPAAARRS